MSSRDTKGVFARETFRPGLKSHGQESRYDARKLILLIYLERLRFRLLIYSVLASVSCPKALYHLERDNLFRITVVVADWLG